MQGKKVAVEAKQIEHRLCTKTEVEMNSYITENHFFLVIIWRPGSVQLNFLSSDSNI